jgi:hypothetical protein
MGIEMSSTFFAPRSNATAQAEHAESDPLRRHMSITPRGKFRSRRLTCGPLPQATISKEGKVIVVRAPREGLFPQESPRCLQADDSTEPIINDKKIKYLAKQGFLDSFTLRPRSAAEENLAKSS